MGSRRLPSVRRRLAPFFLPALLASVVAVGCGSDASSHGSGGVEYGDPDRPASSTLSIDEAGILATVESSSLRISIPVESRTASTAQGALRLAIRSVDGKAAVSQTAVPYTVPGSEKALLSAIIPVPSDVAGQADLVRYVLRIDEAVPDGVRVTTSLLRIVSPYEIRLEGPSSARKDRAAAWRVRAQNPFTRQPIVGQKIDLQLLSGESVVDTRTGTTSATGDAVFDLSVAQAGTYTLAASAPGQGTVVKLESSVQIDEVGPKVLLTTDKPIYQPGQLIHLRMLVLDRQGNTPVANQATTFEVRDGKGNKILKKSSTTDAWGIASTEFRLGSVLNQGDFKITAISGATQTEKTVKVSNYALPKFKADLTTDKSWYLPGQKVVGLIDADYFFGKPVAGGDVQIEAATLDVGETIFQNVQGKTDQDGRFPFEITLPSSLVGIPLENGNAAVVLRAIVSDTAGQQVKKEAIVVVSQDGIDVALVPEATAIVPQVDNQLDLFLVDPAGAPVPSSHVTLTTPNGALQGDTDVYGYASFLWNPGSSCDSSCNIEAQVGAGNGKTIVRNFSFGGQTGKQHVLVRTDRAVYSTGDLVDVEVRGSSAGGHVYLDWINNGQTVDMRTLPIEGGVAKFQASLDNGKLGANRIQAYLVDDDGNVIRAGRTIFVRNNGALSIAMTSDKPQYAPGEPAKLTFTVKDENGAPAVAALGVQIVDEAVFALVDAQPGLLRTYFEIESAFSKPQYEIHGPSGNLSQLVFDDTTSSDQQQAQAAQKKTAATLAAMGETVPAGISMGTWAKVVADSNTLLSPYYEQFKKSLNASIQAVAIDQRAILAAQGCTAQVYWCQDQNASYYDLLMKGVASRLKVYDFWGNKWRSEVAEYSTTITLKTDGPDEKSGTSDDGMISYALQEMGPVYEDNNQPGGGADAGAWGAAGSAGSASGMGGSSSAGASGAQPRVRKYFPETLYVNPALISGPDGTAKVEVPMADSITTWRVSSLANSAGGKLGGGLAGVTVFQDFFADIDFPAALTKGDELQFPITVYNYLTEKQTVTLQLEAGDWYTPLGQTNAVLDVGPGEVVGVRFPVRVEKVGLQTLTVTAKGSKLSDAVARTVRVEPGGKAFPTSVSGAVGAGEITQSISFPAGAIPGSATMHLNVFPAYLATVVQGMDSMLQVPSGCFEQTTSSTWPNVLVTRYMTQTSQITPEIQMKADSMISAGYQRLLTFEHPGGGFSWFGTQDGHPFLSVTAFGVMEFADMKEVHTVDEAMIARTVDWLVAQQKGDGSWEGDQTEFFSFQTSTVRNTAFVMWALGVAGYQGSAGGSALGYLKANAKVGDQDSYTLALLANALQLAAPNDGLTTSVFDRIDATKKVDGSKIYWDSSDTQTNFYGSGNDANVASTAMIVEALLRKGGAPDLVKGGMEYLLASRDSQGNFGSTQATIWTLRALIASATKGTEGAVGSLQVSLDGNPYTTLNLTADQSDVMNTVDFGSFVTAGDHEVKLAFVGSGKASYHLVSKYNLPWDQIPAEPPGPISVSVGYDKTDLALNETVTASVQITNNTASTQNMVLVTLGIPPGFQVMGEDFDQYLSSNVMSNWETTGKQLTLYLPLLAPSQTQTIQYHLIATMPVTASDGGGQAYPYYEPDAKSSVASTTFHVSN